MKNDVSNSQENEGNRMLRATFYLNTEIRSPHKAGGVIETHTDTASLQLQRRRVG